MKIHFIGIGGIGVSALAQYYISKGNTVSGSDLEASETTEFLSQQGVIMFAPGPGHKALDPDLVIYSPAIKNNNLELKYFKDHGIKCLSYPEALGELTKDYFTIAVSGTHGKSTTTSMLGLLLVNAGLDPTVIVGTKLEEFGNTNFRLGKSKYLVIEADEHFASFLYYWPKIIVLTNIEKEHLDYYKNLKNILKTYKEYIKRLPKDGVLIANSDDKNIKKIIPLFFPAKKFSIKQKESKTLRKILKIPGDHNISNALAVLSVARELKISDDVSFKSLSEYKGAWRRFEESIGKNNGTMFYVISDYGHHPTEIRATLKSLREKYIKNRIVCVFQPHQRQRTFFLLRDFIKTFRSAPIDQIIITDIFDVAGREEKDIDNKISAEILVKKISRKKTIYLPKGSITEYILRNIENGDVLIIMGAGDIYKIVKEFN